MDELSAKVLLNTIPEIGPIRANRLLNYFGSAANIFCSTIDEVRTAGEISEQLARKVLQAPNIINAEQEIVQARKSDIEIFTIDNEKYPIQLKSLSDPPIVLYVRGKKITYEDIYSIAVVGTRRPTEYGKIVTEKLTKELTCLGVTIVSGLARGIDTIAHCETIKQKGWTIAILGNGLLRHYPAENRKLEDAIVKSGGALISEFPMNFPPDRGNFPRRNRLIAGISLGTLVIEADQKSGALITAKHAAEQGKDVFAVPGSILSKYSRGTHMLIQQGAKLVESAEDIVLEISSLACWIAKSKKLSETKEKKSSQELPLLTQVEDITLTNISNVPDGINIDQLKERINLSFGELTSALLSLELKGLIKSLPGKVYIKI